MAMTGTLIPIMEKWGLNPLGASQNTTEENKPNN